MGSNHGSQAFVFDSEEELRLFDTEEDQLTAEMVFDILAEDLQQTHGTRPAREDHFAFAMQLVTAYNLPFYLVSNTWCSHPHIVPSRNPFINGANNPDLRYLI